MIEPDAGTHAATDVTGFGLLGHLFRMVQASGVSARIGAATVPMLPGVLDLARGDVIAGGTKRNHAWVSPTTDWGECTLPEQYLLADAQTSGGLLIATDQPDALEAALFRRGVRPARVGTILDGEPGRITITGRV
jgi:selenide,water dikinase